MPDVCRPFVKFDGVYLKTSRMVGFQQSTKILPGVDCSKMTKHTRSVSILYHNKSRP